MGYVTSDKTEREPFIKLLIGTDMEFRPPGRYKKTVKVRLVSPNQTF